MPTYEYRCTACKHQFEEFQSIKAAALTKCPACGKAKLERLIGTGGAILFKGSGFYQTDYRTSAYTEAAKKDAPSDKAASSESPKPTAESAKPASASAPASKPEKAPAPSRGTKAARD